MKSFLPFYLILGICLSLPVYAEGTEVENPSQMLRKPLMSLGLSNTVLSYLSVAPIESQKKAPSMLYQELLPHVIKIVLVDKTTKKSISAGSAVAITDQLLITNCHILTKNFNKDQHLILAKLNKKFRPLQLEAIDTSTDRCALTLTGGGLSPVAAIRSKESIVIGEAVYSLGNPKNFESAFSAGMISAIQTHRNGRTIILTTTALAKGSSGGALFDAAGNLIGITMAVIKDAPHLGIVIPLEDYLN
jgi:S1-C subfamily serine protease